MICPVETGIENPNKEPPMRYEKIDKDTQINLETGEIRSQKSIEKSRRCSMSRTIQKIYDYAHSNAWEYFVTITFDSKFTDRYNYDSCYEKMKKWIDNLRHKNKDMIYLFVPELHPTSGAIHFHGLMSNVDLKLKKSPYEDVYNISSFKWGFTTASIIKDSDKASTYITKYITKDVIVATEKNRYLVSRNIEKPVVHKKLLLNEELDNYINELGGADYVKKVSSADNVQGVTYLHFHK